MSPYSKARASSPLHFSSTSALTSPHSLAHSPSGDDSALGRYPPSPSSRRFSSLHSLAAPAGPVRHCPEFELSVLRPPVSHTDPRHDSLDSPSAYLHSDRNTSTADADINGALAEPDKDRLGRPSSASDAMGPSTPDQPLLGGRLSHNSSVGSLRDSFSDVRPSIEHGESRPRLSSAGSSSSGELTEFERVWSQRRHQRAYQVLALVCTLLIS
ncbi:hypothetical protein H4R20_006516, partial [Coemansia guatemalensis]